MSINDCIKCFETPCVCGWEYRKWTSDEIRKQIEMLQSVLCKIVDEEDEKRALEEEVEYEDRIKKTRKRLPKTSKKNQKKD